MTSEPTRAELQHTIKQYRDGEIVSPIVQKNYDWMESQFKLADGKREKLQSQVNKQKNTIMRLAGGVELRKVRADLKAANEQYETLEKKFDQAMGDVIQLQCELAAAEVVVANLQAEHDMDTESLKSASARLDELEKKADHVLRQRKITDVMKTICIQSFIALGWMLAVLWRNHH